jgi:hypothetical protein
MVLGYHSGDWAKVPAEDEVMAALRKFDIPPGDYGVPRPASMKDMKSPEFIARSKQGPNALLTILSGPPNMGVLLAQWFVYCLLVSLVSAYVSGRALGTGAHYLAVFRFAGCTAFAGYSLALLQNSIWYGRKWSSTLKSMFDGLIFAGVTAGTFGWLWPR